MENENEDEKVEEVTQENVPPEKEPEIPGIAERLLAIEEELKRKNQLIEDKFLYDATKEEMITRLHKELQGYKDDLYKKILKPLILDMIGLADSMRALVSHYEELPEAEVIQEKYQKLRKEFLKIGNHIDDLLYNYGIEPYSAAQGDEFNPRTQQVKRTTVTGKSDEHKHIIESLAAGYTWDDQMLRRESVHVNTYE